MENGILRNRWWIVGASLMAQLVGSGAINVFAFGVFLKPVANDLGVGRGVLSSALLVSASMTAVGCLIFGALFDRLQIRTTLLPRYLPVRGKYRRAFTPPAVARGDLHSVRLFRILRQRANAARVFESDHPVVQ